MSQSKEEFFPEFNLSETVEPFINHVFKNLDKKHFSAVENSDISWHWEMFNNDGLEEIISYRNKIKTQNIKTNYYGELPLFVLIYKNFENAFNAYKEVKYYSEFDFSKFDELKQNEKNIVQLIEQHTKPGGMIVQKGKYLFYLVETCGVTPINGNWIEYENLFLKYITEPNEIIKVLNADCGQMKYFEENRSPVH